MSDVFLFFRNDFLGRWYLFYFTKRRNYGEEMTPENLTFFVKYIFMLRNWYIQNPRALLISNMYTSCSVFYFYALITQPMTLYWSLFPNTKNTVFWAWCFSSTEFSRILFNEALQCPFIAKIATVQLNDLRGYCL